MPITGDQAVGIAIAMDMKTVNQERRNAITRQWEAYHGMMKPPLKVETDPGTGKRGPDDNVMLGFPEYVVEAGVSALFGDCVQFEVVPREGQSDSKKRARNEQEKLLDDILEANHWELLLQKTAVNGGVVGHAFWKLLPSAATGETARIVNLNGAMVEKISDPHDKDRVNEYRIEYEYFDADRRARMRLQLIERVDGVDTEGQAFHWLISDYDKAVGDRTYELVNVVTWPWQFAPMVECENLPSADCEYGRSDLEESILRVCHAINRTCSLINRVLRQAGYPRLYVTGMTVADMIANTPQTSEQIMTLNKPDAKAGILELRGELTAHLETLKKLTALLHELSRIPEVSTGKLDTTGPLSGVALKVLWSPLVTKTNQKRLTYGMLIKEALLRLLIMETQADEQELRRTLKIELTWPNIVPSNDLEEAQVSIIDQQLGASKDTLLRKRGYDPDAEREKRAVDEKDLGEALLRGMNAPPDNTGETN